MVTIRSARLSDASEIAAIHVASWNLEEKPTYDQRLELWFHLLGGGPRRTKAWVALDELGQLVGFGAAGSARVLKGQYDGELTAIYVAPEMQRKGIGRALFNKVLGWFEERGFHSAMAWVPEEGEAASFMAAMGALLAPERRAWQLA
jgi:L-amino acid N-acyltransferase YncA